MGKPTYQKWLWIAGICLVLWSLKGCFFKAHAPAHPPRPVTTTVAGQKDVPFYIESFGNLNAPNNVDVRSQVTGQIQSVHFEEGKEVKKGDLLFSIDPRPFQADLEKAQASLIQSSADFKLKKETLDRNRGLFQSKLISQQDFDQYTTNAATSEATMKLDQASVDLARINLEYCSITAPINGRTGKRNVDPGNIIQSNTGPVLVNIKTVDDLYVDFTIPETELGRVREAQDKNKLKVEVTAENDVKSPYTAELQFLDNAVDNTTGTVQLRALLKNDDRRLWPGQFIRIKLILGIDRSAVVVPYEAVYIGQKGPYAFVVGADNKADLRIVTTGSRYGDQIVVADGIKTGEKVVVTGQMGLAPGVPVIDTTNADKKQSAQAPKKKFIFF